MGKQKRARQKYHLACMSGRLNDEDSKSEAGRSSVSIMGSLKEHKKRKNILDDELFQPVEIDITKINYFPDNDDTKSVKSISKSIKRSIAESGSNIRLKKKDKRELRKNLFIKKVDAVHRHLHDKSKSKNRNDDDDDTPPNLDALPMENMLFFKSEFKQPKAPKPVCLRKKAIAKAQVRKAELISVYEQYRKMISDPNYWNDSGTVTEAVQKKVFNEEI